MVPVDGRVSVPNDWTIHGVPTSRTFIENPPDDLNTPWEPQYDTCDNGNFVALGYHHPRVDYYLYMNITVDSSTGVTLTIKPGTVIAHSAGSTTGKLLIDGTDDSDIGDAINCVGDPANGGYITWVAAGRAANTPYIGVPYSNLSTFIELESGSHYDIRFTKFLGMGFAIVVSEGNGTIRDNQFYANSRGLDLINCAGIQCKNNLFSVNNKACRVVQWVRYRPELHLRSQYADPQLGDDGFRNGIHGRRQLPVYQQYLRDSDLYRQRLGDG